jgi:hypothetical protein
LGELKNMGMIFTETALKNVAVTSLITITNYDQYQGGGTEDDTEDRTVNGTGTRSLKKERTHIVSGVGKPRELKPSFTPPTLDEVTAYCKERNRGVDPEKWFNFYEAKDWMIGKNKMKVWRSAVHTWEKDDSTTASTTQPSSAVTMHTIDPRLSARLAKRREEERDDEERQLTAALV